MKKINYLVFLSFIAPALLLGKPHEQPQGVDLLLHNAVLSENLNAIEILVEQGANVNALYPNDWTPLMISAMSCDEPDTINLLLSLGADKSIRNIDGETAHDIASRNGECGGYLHLLDPNL